MFSTYYITIFLKGKTHEKVLILSIAPPPPDPNLDLREGDFSRCETGVIKSAGPNRTYKLFRNPSIIS